MVKVDKHYVNDRSAAKQSRRSRVSILVIGGKRSSETTSECEFFIPLGITLSDSIEGHCLSISCFPSDDFPSKRTRGGAEHHKLVSYANV